MKTEHITTTSSNLEDLAFGYWDVKTKEFVTSTGLTAENEKIAYKLNCSPELVEAIVNLVEEMKNLIGSDLGDIWEKVSKD